MKRYGQQSSGAGWECVRAQAREVRANQEQGRPVYNVVFLDSDVLVVQPLSEVFDPSFARRVSNNSHSTFAVGTTIAQAGILTSKVAGPSFCARADMQAPNAMVHSFLCVRLTGMFVVCGSAYVCMLVFACVRVPMLAFLTRCIQLLWRMGSLFRDWVFCTKESMTCLQQIQPQSNQDHGNCI